MGARVPSKVDFSCQTGGIPNIPSLKIEKEVPSFIVEIIIIYLYALKSIKIPANADQTAKVQNDTSRQPQQILAFKPRSMPSLRTTTSRHIPLPTTKTHTHHADAQGTSPDDPQTTPGYTSYETYKNTPTSP